MNLKSRTVKLRFQFSIDFFKDLHYSICFLFYLRECQAKFIVSEERCLMNFSFWSTHLLCNVRLSGGLLGMLDWLIQLSRYMIDFTWLLLNLMGCKSTGSRELNLRNRQDQK